MRILLDENLPEGLIEPLRALGHVVDSIGSLKLKGLDNGRLYREVAARYELFFTKDREFAERVTALADPAPVKVILTVIPQMRQPQFVATFMAAFTATRWSDVVGTQEWPMT